MINANLAGSTSSSGKKDEVSKPVGSNKSSDKDKDKEKEKVKENEIVRVGEKRSFPNYQPLKGSQTSCQFNFYNSTNPAAKYTTDAAVGPSIGKVVVESPDILKGTDRKIDVCVKFGGTEIKVTAIDKTSGNTATANLHFLCAKALN